VVRIWKNNLNDFQMKFKFWNAKKYW
jgi:hypothetical protein